MSIYYTSEIEEKTTELIQKRFHVAHDYAKRLAIAALDGIASHGGDPMEWSVVEETINVVVSSWVKNNGFK